MKIHIYGDSYAAPNSHNDFTSDLYWDERSWTYLLKQHHEVKNFAQAGSGIWYSFEQFRATFQDADAVIFAWTDYTRVFLDSPFEGHTATLSHPAALESFLRYAKGREEKKEVYEFLHTASKVFPWMYSETQQRYLAQKCFIDVQQMSRNHGKRLINICTFEDHDTIPSVHPREERAGPMLTALQKVSDRENMIKNRTGPYYDSRANHLFPSNNIVLYELVMERLLDSTLNDIYNCQQSDKFHYTGEDWDAAFSA